MNGDGRANPSAAFTAATEKANRIPGAGTGAGTEPISCEDGAWGGAAQSFKPAVVGEEQLCSGCEPRWCCRVSAGGAQQISFLFPRLGAMARSRLKTIFFCSEGRASGSDAHGLWRRLGTTSVGSKSGLLVGRPGSAWGRVWSGRAGEGDGDRVLGPALKLGYGVS